MGLFESLIAWLGGPWSWILFGVVLLVLEIFVSGTVLLWFGVAALIVGAATLYVAPIWEIQVLAWAALSALLLLIGRRVFRKAADSEDPLINERAHRYTGRAFTLAQPIVEAQGTLRIDDTVWRITGPDLPAGTVVKVIGADGSVLKVERGG